MNAQQKFVVLCAALFEDFWAERIQEELEAMPEEIVWDDCPHYGEHTDEYVDWQLDVEWLRGGC